MRPPRTALLARERDNARTNRSARLVMCPPAWGSSPAVLYIDSAVNLPQVGVGDSPPAQGQWTKSVPRQGHNNPLPLKRSPPVSFKRLLGCTLLIQLSATIRPLHALSVQPQHGGLDLAHVST